MLNNIATISLKINIDLEHCLSRIRLKLQRGRLIRFTLSSRMVVEKVLLCLCFTYNIKKYSFRASFELIMSRFQPIPHLVQVLPMLTTNKDTSATITHIPKQLYV